MSRAHVLLSGGIDSSTCLAIAKDQFGSVRALSIDYGQRHAKETEQARLVANHFGAEFSIFNMQGIIGKGGLTDGDFKVPDKSYAELPAGISPTYVPYRNGTLLSIMASRASADPECEAIFFGAHSEDAENWAYPDCTPEFVGAMANAIFIGTYQKIRLHTPLLFLTKGRGVAWGDELGVPWNYTWSCYKGEEFHCGTCPTCLARKASFIEAGVEDPTYYADHAANEANNRGLTA